MPDQDMLEYYEEWYKKTIGLNFGTFDNRRKMLVGIQKKMLKLGYKMTLGKSVEIPVSK
jgi:hypothetical protein